MAKKSKTPKAPAKINIKNLEKTFVLANKSLNDSDDLYSPVGFAGYEKYGLTFGSDSGAYLRWTKKNDELIKNSDFNWAGIFIDEPYLHYKSGTDGYAFPQFPIASKRFEKNWRENRWDDYKAFVSNMSFKSYERLNVSEIASVQGYRQLVIEQIDLQIKEMEAIDKKIQSVMKVYYYEAERYIVDKYKNQDQEKSKVYYEFLDEIIHLYRVGIRHVAKRDIILDKWLPKRLNKEYVPVEIKNSVTNGINHWLTKKEPIIEASAPMYKQLMFIEILKSRFLEGLPLLDDKDIPEIDEPEEDAPYGFHKKNKKWIIANYKLIKTENSELSNNKIFDLIVEKYQIEFNRIITKSTIIRALEIYNY